jgi:hypothetical protein
LYERAADNDVRACGVEQGPAVYSPFEKGSFVMTKMLRRILSATPVAAGLFCLLSAGTAHAAPTSKTCSVAHVLYDEGPRLIIDCTDGTSFFSFLSGTAGACQSRSLDTIKIWESIVMSTFLAGKHVVLTYEPSSASCGVNSLYSVQATQ